MILRSKSRSYPVKRSAYSGAVVNGSDVILVSEAIEYVIKSGYIVIDGRNVEEIIKFLNRLGYDVVDTKTIFD